ncbi:unannotated protein [freshwater metagenome]|uniref:Unannotated protein n=1 Tax=freshwater metagenome TaxID=449393 RepID=A0A6J7I902_9ZZZZ
MPPPPSTDVTLPGAATSRLRSPTTSTVLRTSSAAGCGRSSVVRSSTRQRPLNRSSTCIRQSAGSGEVISSIVRPVRRSPSGP